MNETHYASYGSLVVQHPRAHVDMTWQIKQAFEEERLREQERFILQAYKPDWFVILAPTLIPLGAFFFYFGLLALKIWLIK